MSDAKRASGGVEIRTLDRALLSEYLEDVLRIEAAVRERMGDVYSHEEWGAEQFLAERPGKWELSACALWEGRLVGFLIASRDGDDAHVHRVAADPEERGAIGLPLMAEVERAARERALDRLTLSVAVENERAIRFYRGLHYRPLVGEPLRVYAAGHGVEFAGDRVRADGRDYLILARNPPEAWG